MILPVLILLNLIKLKMMLLPIFLGVHFIKKLLVLASLIAPSILAHLKICKVAPPIQPAHSYHSWATAAEAPADYPTGKAIRLHIILPFVTLRYLGTMGVVAVTKRDYRGLGVGTRGLKRP